MASETRTALRDLRRTRQRRRLGDTEWFDVAYRVYLFALGGLVAIVLVSDAVDGIVGDGVATADLLARGPAIAGIAVVVAAAVGLRSGADGGPVAIEVADVSHVLLAPIDRRIVMLRPISQRLRSAMFALGLGAGILGQFVAREVEGSRAAWAAAGALFGALVGATFVASAVIAHALRFPRWLATVIGATALVWQAGAASTAWDGGTGALRHGPATLAGSVAFWGIRQRAVDVVAIGVVALLILVAITLGGRLRVEPLVRRGQLVTQLRFAATVQDLRTVVLLRRQLRAETMRRRPWGRVNSPVRRSAPRDATGRHETTTATRPPTAPIGPVVWRRGMHSLRRLPVSRVGRIASLAAVGGVSASLTVSSSPLFALGVLGAVFLLGIEAIEPLAQEIDRPDLTDTLPVDRGVLFTHHLAAPAAALALAAIVGATAATIVDGAHAAAAFALAIPVAWVGATGPVVAAVLDAPAPPSASMTTLTGAPRDQESVLVPPEFAGFATAVSTLLPVALSALAVVPVLAMRASPDAATVARSVVGVGLVLVGLAWWVRRRDRWASAIRRFFAQGRAQQAGGAPS